MDSSASDSVKLAEAAKYFAQFLSHAPPPVPVASATTTKDSEEVIDLAKRDDDDDGFNFVPENGSDDERGGTGHASLVRQFNDDLSIDRVDALEFCRNMVACWALDSPALVERARRLFSNTHLLNVTTYGGCGSTLGTWHDSKEHRQLAASVRRVRPTYAQAVASACWEFVKLMPSVTSACRESAKTKSKNSGSMRDWDDSDDSGKGYPLYRFLYSCVRACHQRLTFLSDITRKVDSGSDLVSLGSHKKREELKYFSFGTTDAKVASNGGRDVVIRAPDVRQTVLDVIQEYNRVAFTFVCTRFEKHRNTKGEKTHLSVPVLQKSAHLCVIQALVNKLVCPPHDFLEARVWDYLCDQECLARSRVVARDVLKLGPAAIFDCSSFKDLGEGIQLRLCLYVQDKVDEFKKEHECVHRRGIAMHNVRLLVKAYLFLQALAHAKAMTREEVVLSARCDPFIARPAGLENYNQRLASVRIPVLEFEAIQEGHRPLGPFGDLHIKTVESAYNIVYAQAVAEAKLMLDPNKQDKEDKKERKQVELAKDCFAGLFHEMVGYPGNLTQGRTGPYASTKEEANMTADQKKVLKTDKEKASQTATKLGFVELSSVKASSDSYCVLARLLAIDMPALAQVYTFFRVHLWRVVFQEVDLKAVQSVTGTLNLSSPPLPDRQRFVRYCEECPWYPIHRNKKEDDASVRAERFLQVAFRVMRFLYEQPEFKLRRFRESRQMAPVYFDIFTRLNDSPWSKKDMYPRDDDRTRDFRDGAVYSRARDDPNWTTMRLHDTMAMKSLAEVLKRFDNDALNSAIDQQPQFASVMDVAMSGSCVTTSFFYNMKTVDDGSAPCVAVRTYNTELTPDGERFRTPDTDRYLVIPLIQAYVDLVVNHFIKGHVLHEPCALCMHSPFGSRPERRIRAAVVATCSVACIAMQTASRVNEIVPHEPIVLDPSILVNDAASYGRFAVSSIPYAVWAYARFVFVNVCMSIRGKEIFIENKIKDDALRSEIRAVCALLHHSDTICDLKVPQSLSHEINESVGAFLRHLSTSKMPSTDYCDLLEDEIERTIDEQQRKPLDPIRRKRPSRELENSDAKSRSRTARTPTRRRGCGRGSGRSRGRTAKRGKH